MENICLCTAGNLFLFSNTLIGLFSLGSSGLSIPIKKVLLLEHLILKKSLLADLFQKAPALNNLELLNLEGTFFCHRSFFHILFIVAHFMIISMPEHR